jgi:hypothetical protein
MARTSIGVHSQVCTCIYIYILFASMSRGYLQEEGTPGANHGPKEVSVHSEEQQTGSEDSRFDCFFYHDYNLHF